MTATVCRGASRVAGQVVVVFVLATASMAEEQYELFSVHASGSAGTGSYSVSIAPPGDEQVEWTLDTPTELFDPKSGVCVATLHDAGVTIQLGGETQQVSMWFVVEAGDEDMEMWLGSEMLSFEPMDSAEGTAAAAMTLTDGNGDGAAIWGGPAAEHCASHWFNGEAPEGSLFFQAITGLEAGPGGSASGAENMGAFELMPETTENMSMLFNCGLTARDTVSGTGIFVIQALPSGDDTCPADVTGDGVVDVADLVSVILAWGANGGQADVNDDGVVGVADLQEVTLSWGPCGS